MGARSVTIEIYIGMFCQGTFRVFGCLAARVARYALYCVGRGFNMSGHQHHASYVRGYGSWGYSRRQSRIATSTLGRQDSMVIGGVLGGR